MTTLKYDTFVLENYCQLNFKVIYKVFGRNGSLPRVSLLTFWALPACSRARNTPRKIRRDATALITTCWTLTKRSMSFAIIKYRWNGKRTILTSFGTGLFELLRRFFLAIVGHGSRIKDYVNTTKNERVRNFHRQFFFFFFCGLDKTNNCVTIEQELYAF